MLGMNNMKLINIIFQRSTKQMLRKETVMKNQK